MKTYCPLREAFGAVLCHLNVKKPPVFHKTAITAASTLIPIEGVHYFNICLLQGLFWAPTVASSQFLSQLKGSGLVMKSNPNLRPLERTFY